MSGYDIKQLMSTSTNFFFQASFGSIYPTLKSLEKKSCVVSKELTENKKIKIVYSITDKGRKKFLNWLEAPTKIAKVKDEFLVKLFFARNLDEDKLIRAIQAHIEELKEIISQLELIDKMAQNADKFQRYTLKFGLDYYKFHVSWYQNLIDKIREDANFPICFKDDDCGVRRD